MQLGGAVVSVVCIIQHKKNSFVFPSNVMYKFYLYILTIHICDNGHQYHQTRNYALCNDLSNKSFQTILNE
jgi:hypothetical protein